MIAARVLGRAEWEERLRRHNCRPMVGKGSLNTAEWWVTDWGFLFTVPAEGPDGVCGEMEIDYLIRNIEDSRPPH